MLLFCNRCFLAVKCDGFNDCVDSSDETDCFLCGDNEFACECSSITIPHCFNEEGCISKEKHLDGQIDCPNGSDEAWFVYESVFDNITMLRYRNASECELRRKDDSEQCDFLTCYETLAYYCLNKGCNTTNLICFTCHDFFVECNYEGIHDIVFQCGNGNLFSSGQFCDGFNDCGDNSDEMLNQPGFKCIQTKKDCVLPQLNLYDNVSHCEDGRDLCHNNNTCFECFDKHLLLSSQQVCDGVIDCYDLSDECLCSFNIWKPNCDAIFTNQNNGSPTVCSYDMVSPKLNPQLFIEHQTLVSSLLPGKSALRLKDLLVQDDAKSDTIMCEGRGRIVRAVPCDGVPECADYSDECKCDNPPSFCNNTCYYFYPLGDRYCDGVIDPAWEFINDSSCPRGFDEKDCPDRFYCETNNTDQVSIYATQKCDGIKDSKDESDEQDCSSTLSSETEMIANPALQSSFWIMGFIVVISNFFVIVFTGKHLNTKDLSDSLRCQHMIIVNISCADFTMGIYLIIIAILSQIYSGYYGSVDVEWRASWHCSITGSLAVISSEASCFLMVVLSAFRLYTISNPYATMTLSVRPWKIAIGGAWLIALVLGLIPIPNKSLDYFTDSIYFPNQFNPEGIWKKDDLAKVACNAAAMRNLPIASQGSDWNSKRQFLEEMFPDDLPLIEFGYYGETSICMPRFYAAASDNAWEYTLMIITINLLAFIVIACCYILMFVKFREQRAQFQQNHSLEQETKMQKKIARIIATDFACWIPICIMSYARIGGVEFSNVLYQITAVILLPINSAINPLLFSPVIDKLTK